MSPDTYFKFNFSDIGDMQLINVKEINDLCSICGDVTDNFICCEVCDENKTTYRNKPLS